MQKVTDDSIIIADNLATCSEVSHVMERYNTEMQLLIIKLKQGMFKGKNLEFGLVFNKE